MASSIGCCSHKAAHQGGLPKWRSPRAAIIPNFHLPMRSYEIKNRTNVDDIKSLRLIITIKTPYLPDGRFDPEAYDALVNMQIEDGVEGVIVGGTTGEGQLMSWDKHITLIGHTVNCFGGSIKVIGNTGSNSTWEAIHATEQGFAVGMHAALTMAQENEENIEGPIVDPNPGERIRIGLLLFGIGSLSSRNQHGAVRYN